MVALDETYQKHLKVVGPGMESRYRSGDKLAVLDCLRWCDEYGLQVPNWALRALSQAAGFYLTGRSVNFHDALFGAPKSAGRHSSPARARRETRDHQFWFDLVFALRQQGYKGDGLYERANELLMTMHVDAGNRLVSSKHPTRKVPLAETIKTTVERMKRARPSGFAHFIPMMVDLGDRR